VNGICTSTFKPFSALQVQTAAVPVPSGVPAITNAALYDWAERRYPQYFRGAAVDGSGTDYVYRFYPGTGNYIAVKAGEVTVSGTLTQGAVLLGGTLDSLAAVVSASSGDTWTCIHSSTVNCLGFDEAGVGLSAFGGLSAAVVADPLDAGNKVARLVKPATAETWAGATVRTDAATNTVATISFAAGSVVSLRMLSPAVGETIMLKVEGSTNGGTDLEAQATTGSANAWETLSFDFSKPTAGSYNAARSYRIVSVFPHYGAGVPSERVYHVDELSLRTTASLPADTGNTGTCFVTSLVNCQDFDGASMGLVPFGGLSASYTADPASAANGVVKLVKHAGGDVWAGTAVGPGSSAGTVTPVKFGAYRTVTLRVFSPAAGEKMMLKLENSVNYQTVYVEAVASTVGAGAWETLTFDFDKATAGTYDRNSVYDRTVLFPRPGVAVAADQIWYVDELALKTEDKLTGWNLVWADEFDTNGLPDAAKWDYDTERNAYGWYNNELQYYSRARLANSAVSAGKLNITAIRENLSGSVSDWGPSSEQFTSARLITRGKASWTYGFFEVRAKLPCSLGTWPAIWTLGTGGRWPEDGEIDIMEQRGISTADKAVVLGTIHDFASYNGLLGGVSQGSQITLADACTAFHNYQLTWNAQRIVMAVDDGNYFTYLNPGDGDVNKWPFDHPQYMLLNLAMGGVLGGPVPAGFVSDQMQVEYVRVYQK
jgi:beta-glucanase (GH16 family)